MAVKKVIGSPKNSEITFSSRKLEVLTMSAKLFNARGYHSTSMEDVAMALGVTKPALYYYAKSKDELLWAINSHSAKQFEEKIENTLANDLTGAEKLKEFFTYWMKHITSDFGRCMVLTRPQNLASTSRKKQSKSRRKLQDGLVKILEIGYQDKSLVTGNAEITAMAIFDLINGPAYWYKPKGKQPIKEITDIYWDSFMSNLIR